MLTLWDENVVFVTKNRDTNNIFSRHTLHTSSNPEAKNKQKDPLSLDPLATLNSFRLQTGVVQRIEPNFLDIHRPHNSIKRGPCIKWDPIMMHFDVRYTRGV